MCRNSIQEKLHLAICVGVMVTKSEVFFKHLAFIIGTLVIGEMHNSEAEDPILILCYAISVA